MPSYNDERNSPGFRFASLVVDFLTKEEKNNSDFHQQLLGTFHEEVIVKGSARCEKILEAGEKLSDVLKHNLGRFEKHVDWFQGKVESLETAATVLKVIGIGVCIVLVCDMARTGYDLYDLYSIDARIRRLNAKAAKATAAAKAAAAATAPPRKG